MGGPTSGTSLPEIIKERRVSPKHSYTQHGFINHIGYQESTYWYVSNCKINRHCPITGIFVSFAAETRLQGHGKYELPVKHGQVAPRVQQTGNISPSYRNSQIGSRT